MYQFANTTAVPRGHSSHGVLQSVVAASIINIQGSVVVIPCICLVVDSIHNHEALPVRFFIHRLQRFSFGLCRRILLHHHGLQVILGKECAEWLWDLQDVQFGFIPDALLFQAKKQHRSNNNLTLK
jgi:hypothetical protein